MGCDLSSYPDSILDGAQRVNVQTGIAAALAGLSVGILALSLFSLAMELSTSRQTKSSMKHRRNYRSRLKTLLSLIVMPGFFRALWSGPLVSARLLQAGLEIEVRDFAALRWLSAWLGIGIAIFIFYQHGLELLGLFIGLIVVLAGIWGPSVWLKLRMERRRSEIDLALPDLLDRLSLGLNAGLSFETAFRRTARSFPGRFGGELRRVNREWQLGHTRSGALRALSDRNPADSLSAFITAVNQCDELGTSLSVSLRVQSKLLRSQRRRRAQEASRRLPILIAFPLVLFFLPALLIIYLVPPLLTLFFGG